MDTIENRIKKNEIGITVYSPDTYYSNLSELIDKKIFDESGLVPICRVVIKHTSKSIEKFYSEVVYKNVPNWNLVETLFTSGPSLLTIWYGEDAIEKLMKLKGKSHPKLAKEGTIRSMFWCENGVCNLIHTSDDIQNMIHELTALGKLYLIKEKIEIKHTTCDFFNDGNVPCLKHNGTYVFIKNLKTLMSQRFSRNIDLPTFTFDDARRTHSYLNDYLEKIYTDAPDELKILIGLFLSGDEDFFQVLNQYIEASSWDAMVMHSSLFAQRVWNNSISLDDVLKQLIAKIPIQKGSMIGGSVATKLLGYPCCPSDIDIICTDEILKVYADLLHQTILEQKEKFGTYQYFIYPFHGWMIEFSNMATYQHDIHFKIDDEMIERAGELLPMMPIEDIIIENLSLGKKNKAKDLHSFFKQRIDDKYFEKRLNQTNLKGIYTVE